jgi:hypothetical protein
MNFDRVGFRAVVEANRATRTSGALILGVFHAFPVKTIGKFQAGARAGLDAPATTLAFIRENAGVGQGKPLIFLSRHGVRIAISRGLINIKMTLL